MTSDFTYDQRFHVGHVGQQREDFEAVDESVCFGFAPLDFEGEYRACPVGEVALVEGVVGVVGQSRVVDLLYLGVTGQEIDYAQGILDVTLDAQREGLEPLQQQEGVEGADGGAGVAQNHGPDAGDVGGGSGHVGKSGAVVAGVGLAQLGEFARGGPVEAARVDDDAAQRGAVAADELGGRVYHDVGSVFDGADEVGGAEGVVDDERDAVAVGYLGHGIDVDDARVGVAQRLDEDGLGVGLYGPLEVREVGRVDEGGGHAVGGQCVVEQVVGASVDGVGGDNVVAGDGQILDGVGDGGSSRGDGQCGDTPLECGDAPLEYILGRIAQTAVDVARLLQVEAGGGVGRVGKYVRGGLVDGYGPCVGGRVGLLLPHVELERFEMQFLRVHIRFCFYRLV